MAEDTVENSDLLGLTAEIVSSHVAHNQLAAGELPNLIEAVHAALAGLGKDEEAAPATPEHVPATSVRKSLASPSHIISLIDGKPYATLKRHLGRHGLTPAQYRQRYGLKPDYPMVAPAYAELRRGLAKTIGLGRKAGAKIVEAAHAVDDKIEEVVAPKAPPRQRKPKGDGAATSEPAKAGKAAKTRRQ